MPSKFRRTCTECGKSLEDKAIHAKTCGDVCRSKRSRRLKRRAKETAYENSDHLKALSEVVRHEVPDIAHTVIQEEMRPVVREAMTEDVLRSIHELVALTPDAIAALKEDLHSDDAVVRGKATTLVLKYTMGHPAIVRPSDADPSSQLVVNLNLPRPEVAGGETHEATAIEEDDLVRQCDMCLVTKPVADFAAESYRCTECWDQQRASVLSRYGE